MQRFFYDVATRIGSRLGGTRLFALIPAVTLGSYWIGGEVALTAVALCLPALLVLLPVGVQCQTKTVETDAVTGLSLRDAVIDTLDDALRAVPRTRRTTACLVLELDDNAELVDRLGHKAAEGVMVQTANRIRGAIRSDDTVSWLGNGRFAVALAPVRRADLETLIQITGRLQSVIAEPISIDATSIYVTCSVGYCLASRTPEQTGTGFLSAAEAALQAAHSNGPGAIRGYSSELNRTTQTRRALQEEVATALENGDIRPWYQPQMSTDTGKVTGVEALARWCHPERGVITPADFLPAINDAGLSERLGELMLYQSLSTLRSWDKAGLNIPRIGVNFSSEELQNPTLPDKIRWELDRFDIAPNRLCIEILETVVADPKDDTITRNLAALSALGCYIDLDDFGVGNASITNIQRFAVDRIKIDRSFVTHTDTDQDQQRMIAAILTMAAQLGLDTLAEGVETVGEHAILAQLGCGHVQGYGIAKPMPADEIPGWIGEHAAKLDSVPRIARKTG
ncbi:putative bifunctional diguanylate cyclase/phosphodiesterase [Aliiroseovarius sp. YM-037]|uniref:putative bifunctional diguanylate cyclase/phosphodiesterase n=1 Tax=Aliiroseovarius sp. YM-037 TaxID=3341728 RepID=UPI003A812CE8